MSARPWWDRRQFAHLARRFIGSWSKDPPTRDQLEWVASILNTGEHALWRLMSNADQRHSILVAERMREAAVTAAGEAPIRDDLAAALLHDVGKVTVDLGPLMRTAATIIGPRTHTFRRYHDHERIGAELMRATDSSAESIALVDGTSTRRAAMAALRRADDI